MDQPVHPNPLRKSNFPVFTQDDVPECINKENPACDTTPGCQFYNDNCIPKPRGLMANQVLGKHDEVYRTLSVLSEKDVEEINTKFNNARGTPAEDVVVDRDNQNRWFATNMSKQMMKHEKDSYPRDVDPSSKWEPRSVSGIKDYVGNDIIGDKCPICLEGASDDSGLEQMHCCGAIFHKNCLDEFYRFNPNADCPGCKREHPSPLAEVAPPQPPRRNRRRWPIVQPVFRGFDDEPLTATVHAENGECLLGRPGNNDHCVVDWDLAVMIATILQQKSDDTDVNPFADDLHGLVATHDPMRSLFETINITFMDGDPKTVFEQARLTGSRANFNIKLNSRWLLPDLNAETQDNVRIGVRGDFRIVNGLAGQLDLNDIMDYMIYETEARSVEMENVSADMEQLKRFFTRMDENSVTQLVRIENIRGSVQTAMNDFLQQGVGWVQSGTGEITKDGRVFKYDLATRTLTYSRPA